MKRMPNYVFSDADDADEINIKYQFRQKVNNEKLALDRTPLFAYDFLDLDQTDYCFNQECIDRKDIIAYFTKVKDYSKRTLNDLIENTDYREHFHLLNSPTRQLKDLIKSLSGKKDLKDEHLPQIGQFGLYTNENISPADGAKSPRIFFFVGKYAVIYILLYDPYHTIYRGNK